jgi:hypothetical protein
MRWARRATAILAALALGAARAAACEVPATAPEPVWLGGAAQPAAILLMPALWAPGDPAALLAGGTAFRLGCADRMAALLLGEGMLVLALRDAVPGAEEVPLHAALAALRDGFGAGRVVLVWPADQPAPGIRSAMHRGP